MEVCRKNPKPEIERWGVMPKFKKKVFEVHAEQYLPGKPKPSGVILIAGVPMVETLNGRAVVKPGDWVITGFHGERYPCDRKVFEETYEEIQ